MRVRVGISTRNRCDLLGKALDSVLLQDYPNVEIAVLDDASTDGTWDLRTKYPGVTWAREDCQQGQMQARNRLMSETTAEVYVSLDDDAWFVRGDEISLAANLLSQHPEIAVIGFDILTLDQPQPKPRGDPTPLNTFIGCGAALRLDAVRRAGAYLPVPGIYGAEEGDLSIRILDQGGEIVLMPGVHVWHDKANFGTDLPWKHRSGVCNDLSFALRRYPVPQVYWLFAAKMFSHLGFAIKMGLLRAYLAGVVDFARSLPAVIRHRAPVRPATLLEFRRRGRKAG